MAIFIISVEKQEEEAIVNTQSIVFATGEMSQSRCSDFLTGTMEKALFHKSASDVSVYRNLQKHRRSLEICKT